MSVKNAMLIINIECQNKTQEYMDEHARTYFR